MDDAIFCLNVFGDDFRVVDEEVLPVKTDGDFFTIKHTVKLSETVICCIGIAWSRAIVGSVFTALDSKRPTCGLC